MNNVTSLNPIQDLITEAVKNAEANSGSKDALVIFIGTNGKNMAWAAINDCNDGQEIQADVVGIGEVINFMMNCRGPERSVAYSTMLDIKAITDDAMTSFFDAVAKIQAAETVISTMIAEKPESELITLK